MNGWLRYWICDSSGLGHGKWDYLYAPGITDKEDAKEWILRTYESWAIYGCAYSMEIELNVIPPDNEVYIAIEHYETLAKDYTNIANKLKAFVGLNDDSFPSEPDSSGS